jgi:transcriptional regulator GlxA family with amidase domain
LRAGTLVLIVPWVRRHWWGPAGAEVTWCHFDVDEPTSDVPGESLIGREVDVPVEAAALNRLREHQRGTKRREAALAIEGELKAILGRFAATLATSTRAPSIPRPTASDAAIRRATDWLATHYARADAIQRLPEIADLSPKHFRECFRRRTGMNAQRYLLTLRMRLARFYLHESTMQVKQTAAAVGYVDALYFSKIYRKFWGKSPTDDIAEAAHTHIG